MALVKPSKWTIEIDANQFDSLNRLMRDAEAKQELDPCLGNLYIEMSN